MLLYNASLAGEMKIDIEGFEQMRCLQCRYLTFTNEASLYGVLVHVIHFSMFLALHKINGRPWTC